MQSLQEGMEARDNSDSAEARSASVRSHVRYGIGICFLLATVVIWVLSGELIKYIYSEDDGLDFHAPFFLTYFNTSLFMIYLLGFLFLPQWKLSPSHPSVYEVVRGKLSGTRPAVDGSSATGEEYEEEGESDEVDGNKKKKGV